MSFATNRRGFARACIAAMLAARIDARAAPGGPYRIVIRMPGNADVWREFDVEMVPRLAEQLAPFGYVEGRNLTLVAQYHQSALISDAHLAEIRAQRPDAVVCQGVASAIALRNVFPHIPVVTWGVEDPVAAGLAESFTRPGGSVTGLTQGCSAVYPKQVDFLLKAVPDLKGIAVMGAQRDVMEDDADRQYRHLTVAIRARNLSYLPVPGTGRRALEALPTLRQRGFQAAIYFHNPDPLARATQKQHAAEAIRHRVVTLGFWANMADDGFLASYGDLYSGLFRRLAQQLDLVLRGVKPGSIPFIEPERFHLKLNRKTANALGLSIKPDVLILADEVIS